MGRTVGIGVQDFSELIRNNYFYIDKTHFIKEWWESGDSVTLITRPRRFGKTLNMNMLEQFFSVDYAGQGDIFEGLSIWQEEKYRQLQGTYPVIFLSFARVKEITYEDTVYRICEILRDLYKKFAFLRDSNALSEEDKTDYIRMLKHQMSTNDAASAIYQLSRYLYQYYGKKVIIILDEYDTPMQEAYVNGYWQEMVSFTRSLFNSTFKTNPWLGRAIMTGITRVSKESVFSDPNNLKVITTTSDMYATSFGFTEKEVFEALEEYGLSDKREDVKYWYDGFIFGKHADIYNPWSIINLLDEKKLEIWWANTSSNSLVGKLIRESSGDIKGSFELLIQGKSIKSPVDEQIIFNQLDNNEAAIWSLLLASGYLKVLSYETESDAQDGQEPMYELALTNNEVRRMFQKMIREWFMSARTEYNYFVKALLAGDVDAMNDFMNRVALKTFSYFDTGSSPSSAEPERFYHGFVLGLMVDLQNQYIITSNQESGFGRYDVVIEPKIPESADAIIMEFKVRNKLKEDSLKDTVKTALDQIEEKQYAVRLLERGFKKEQIKSYGFAFEGKTVLIGE